jgi:hypothetical protein
MEKELEELCYVYILYFDEEKGHMPLLMYPDDELKNDKDFMRPIKYHPVWFLEIEESAALDHIDLEYKGYTFFGKKFLTKSGREKRRAGLDEETPETIVMIISVPNDLNIFGDELLAKLIKIIQEKYRDNLNDIIECELAKDEVIKTPQVKQCIEKGMEIKKEMKSIIRSKLKEFFSSVIKERDATSIRKQKAISFLALKGYDVSHIKDGKDSSFSNIKIFDPNKQEKGEPQLALPFKIVDISISEESDELEILVRNNTEKEYSQIQVRITHLKEFFEKEVMNQTIDTWFPKEELLFISPIIPHINEYLFFLIKAEDNKKLLTKKINIDMLKQKAN